ncbi:MAG TPA: YbhB/YbcL family Raf kinase inhibitor-like protein, partial [Blastocatellia bacterium]|nr:YbhB/YbcL family Raf kinase inhibitor-like protein [Blastocatellia bacterium]
CEDQDAPIGVFLHWVVFNIPVADASLAERQPKDQTLASGAMQGMTDFDSVGYGGPCPPIGKHRYFFHVYALDTPLESRPGANRDEIEKAIKGHILAQGQLMGTYKKR